MIFRAERLNNNIIDSEQFRQELSLDMLVTYLKDKIQSMDPLQQLFPKFILDRIQAIKQVQGSLDLENMIKYEEIFNHIYYLTSNILSEENIVWALGLPIPDQIFYGQIDFYSLLDKEKELITDSVDSPFYHEMEFANKVLYLLILERCYNLPSSQLHQLYKIVDNDVSKYYQLKIDFSFVKVSCLSKDLSTLDFSCIHEREIKTFEEVRPILASIDLKSFLFEGFTVLKFIDRTKEQAGVMIQRIISKLPNLDVIANVSSFNRDKVWGELKDILKTLTNLPAVQCSFFPLMELNGVPILNSVLSKESIFFGDLIRRDSAVCNNEIYGYLKSPYTISYGIEEKLNTTDKLFIAHLEALGLTSYVCFPLKSKNKLVGFLELFTNGAVRLDKEDLLGVMSYLPLITNLSMDLVSTFKSSIDKVILDKYTSLQEAVQWKFNQEASNYLSTMSISQDTEVQLGEIKFEKVYPVYGAVDIRNSTKLRNMAYRKDSYQRLGYIQLIVDQLESIGPNSQEQKFINRFALVKSWLDEGKLDHFLLDILSFFQEDVRLFLDELDHSDVLLRKYKDDYLKDNEGAYGIVHGASEQFEQTLMMLNAIISTELNLFNETIQGYFPSYFEKFRTDGVEYDMYIGQSITPTKIFDPKILQTIRKQQIVSMVSIARKTFEALDDLPVSLVTTQLIFVHPNPLDVVFRQDERRFDVDGGYNIRYEVIKKRIDKARLVGTKERLVQPNKIAIVYSSPRVEDELRTILENIAKEQLIHQEIEQVELEELQGIEQLKAFRISVLF